MGRSTFLIVLGVAGLAVGPLSAQSTKSLSLGDQRTEGRFSAARDSDAAGAARRTSTEGNRLSDSRPITPTGRSLSHAGEVAPGRTAGAASLWKTFGALGLVLGLIVLGARLWKKHGPRIAAGLPAEAMEVLGKRHLDSRQSIQLVRLGSRILVLGSTPAGLRTLAELTDPVEVDYLAGLCRRDDTGGGVAQSFQALFRRQAPVGIDQKAAGWSIDGETDAASSRSQPRKPEHEFSLNGGRAEREENAAADADPTFTATQRNETLLGSVRP